jgi:N-methylhydantoinase A
VRVANAEMTRALRLVTVERGIDPRDHALLAFGGAGPLHAVAIAEELGIARVLVPRASGVLAALGLVVAPRRRDAQRTVLRAGEALTTEAVAADVAELAQAARAALGAPEAELATTFELRYRGQAFELAIEAAPDATPALLRAAFEAAHAERYGYRDPAQEVELVTVRVSASVSAPPLTAAAPTAAAPEELVGPTVHPLPESTVLVPAGWRGAIRSDGTIDLQREPA